MKKKFLLPTLLLIIVLSALIFTSCDSKETGDTKINLNSTYVTMYVNDTFTVEADKQDSDGKIITINDLILTSENENIVKVENNIVKAVAIGNAYVKVKAENETFAVFFQIVEKPDEGGLKILLSDDILYVGVNTEISTRLVLNGNVINTSQYEVKFSSSDTQSLLISQGILSPVRANNKIEISAECSYNGKTFMDKREIKIEEPYIYYLSSDSIKLAGRKTISGKDNSAFTSTEISILRKNLSDESVEEMKLDNLSVSVQDSSVIGYEIKDKKISLNSVNCGNTNISVCYNEQLFNLKAEVVIPVNCIEDMDRLSLASINDEEKILSCSYMLTRDIDYEGKIILPIATSSKSIIGIPSGVGYEWVYFLKKQDGKYVSSRTDEQTLTDEEFIEFCNNGGINPADKSKTYSSQNGSDYATAFGGTFDGNGLSINNAKLMFSPYVYKNGNLYMGYNSSIFGILSGKIENLSINNLTQEEPDAKTDCFWLSGENEVNKTRTFSKNHFGGRYTGYATTGAGVINKADGATVKNIFLDIEYSLECYGKDGAIVGSSHIKSLITNCVVNIRNAKEGRKITGVAMVGNYVEEYNTAIITNNILSGSDILSKTVTALYNKDNVGSDGNWYCDGSVDDLLKKEKGEDAFNVKPLESIKDYFTDSIWDFSEFNLTDLRLPKLKIGCSIK